MKSVPKFFPVLWVLGVAFFLGIASAETNPRAESPRVANEQSPSALRSDRHVVVVVWDGMRPDLVTAQNTPTLWQLAQQGATFRRHHSIYPTATDVNGAAIATGVYPNRSGLLANREYRPAVDPNHAFENCEPEIIRKGDEVTGGNYLALPTIAEIVHAAGARTAIAGTKSVAFLFDRHADWSSAASKNSITRFAAAPMLPSEQEKTWSILGPYLTGSSTTSEERNRYATCTLTDILWRDELPTFSLLWLSDPDLTQHEYSPGAPASMSAIKNSDRNLEIILDTLRTKKVLDKTDLFIVSDHGFSTIERAIDFSRALRDAGFDILTGFEQSPKAGQVMVVENGGTILFYILGHDQDVAARLVEWLQQSDFAGVVFTREKFEGTFPLESIRADNENAPDVIVALRWNPAPNRFGIKGHIVTDSARKSGEGSHATLSEFDVHNILIACGPDFRRGFKSDLPSGNIDLAPTVLYLLGLRAPEKFDGRVLLEAITNDSPGLQSVSETLRAARKFSSGKWQQHLTISRVGETTYIDEGNGAFDKD